MFNFIGHYTSPQLLVNDPDYFDVLKDQLGITTLIIGGSYNFSPKVRALNPLPPETSPDRGPGTGITDDDSLIRNAIDVAHRKGFKIWLSAGGFRDGSPKSPELLARDINGRLISEYTPFEYFLELDAVPFCPTNEKTKTWFKAAYAEIASLYEADGLDVTHFRYSAPAFFPSIFSCACPNCQKEAEKLGYDFPKIKKALLGLQQRLQQKLDAKTVKAVSDLGLSFLDFLQLLGHDSGGIADWFNFRADIVTNNMIVNSEAVASVARKDFVFGVDSFVPSFSMLVGHKYSDYKKFSSYTSSLISWTDFFILATFASHANLLMKWTKGLREEEALRAVYTFYGYGKINMPTSIAEMKIGSELGMGSPECVPVKEIMELEIRKARILNDGAIPSYPIVKGIYWPREVIEYLVKVAEEVGHEGIVYHQGTGSLIDHEKAKRDAYTPS